MRTILFTGKGGVGKTTLAAATALRSASLGHRTLVISTDIAHSLADALATPLGNEPRPVNGSLEAAELDTGEELERYWGDVKRRIATLLRQEGVEATAAGELAILPGLDEVLALVRIKRYHDEGRYDTLIIDSAPTGAAMRLLGAPDLQRWYTQNLLGLGKGLSRMLLPALRNVVNLPITEAAIQSQLQALFDQVGALRALLTDAEVTSVRLVLNPDHMSLQETQRAHTYMSLFGLSVDAVLVNRVLPAAVTDPYFGQWKADQSRYLGLIRQTFEPLPVIEVPLRRQEVVGVPALRELAAELFGETNPASRLSDVQTLRFFVEGERQLLALRVSGVPAGEVGLEKQGSLLRVRLGQLRRSIVLPDYLAGLQPAWARLADGELQVAFEEPERTNR